MSKVICDICGTSYPETSTQCPICGSARSAESAALPDEETGSSGYTYVKGGRFSKANVRKRNQGTDSGNTSEKPTNTKTLGLIIVLACLILIVVAMIVVIMLGWLKNKPAIQPDPVGTTDSAPVEVACTQLVLSQTQIRMTAENEIWILDVSALPENTTDTVTYSSSNESVATVSESGKITCIGKGQAEITITCGDQTAYCTVYCDWVEETEPPTIAPEGIRLNRKSITADYEGFSWILYDGDVAAEEIVWSSDDPTVATVENGVVVAVGEGQTQIHAVYNGITTSCSINCVFEEATIPEGEGEDHGGTSATGDDEYILYSQYGDKIGFDAAAGNYDVTVSVGQSVGLYLKNSQGDTLTLTWTITQGNSCSVDENYVTVISSDTNCIVEAEYDGIIYTCLIRTVN